MNQVFVKEDIRYAFNLGKRIASGYVRDLADKVKNAVDPDIQRARNLVSKCQDVVKTGVTVEMTIRPAKAKEEKENNN